MKSLYIALVLLVAVVSFLAVNYFITDSFLEKTDNLISALPESPIELEHFTGTSKVLETVKNYWDKRELYLCISLEHDMRRDFYEELLRAVTFCEQGRLQELASSLTILKDRIKYIRFNENADFGNIM